MKARYLVVLLAFVLAACGRQGADQATPAADVAATPDIAMDSDDIAGVVTSANGAEAGVWVIAETFDLGTKFARIVVTDDEGRYLVPDLPDAN